MKTLSFRLIALATTSALACTTTGPREPDEPAALRLQFEPFAGSVLNMTVGTSLSVSVRVLAPNGTAVIPSTGPTIISRNPAAVAVDQTGRVTALAAGSTYLVAEAQVGAQHVQDSVSVVAICTLELRIEITPHQQVLLVGGHFAPTVSLTTCGGHVTLSDVFIWSASNPTVLSVDPITGATTALTVGAATVRVRGMSYGVLAEIPVTVQ